MRKYEREFHFRKCSVEDVNEIDPSDAEKLTSFLFPGKALSFSGTAAGKLLIKLLSSRRKVAGLDRTESKPEKREESGAKSYDEQLSTALRDSWKLNISERPKIRGGKLSSHAKEKASAPKKSEKETNSFIDNSSDVDRLRARTVMRVLLACRPNFVR